MHPLGDGRLTDLSSLDYIHWIDETLIKALQLAPPSLSISIRVHVTGAPENIQALPYARDTDDKAKSARHDSRSELEDAEAMGQNKDSILAVEAVKLENGRCDLSSVLRDEVEMASGRMSVSGQSSLHAANYNEL